MVREYIEIRECSSITALIEHLKAVKRGMPAGSSEEQLHFRGDDNFGRHLLVTYLRPETAAEAAAAHRASEFSARWQTAGEAVPCEARH